VNFGFDAGLFGFGLVVGCVEGGVGAGGEDLGAVGGGGGGRRHGGGGSCGWGDVPFGEAGFALAVLKEEEANLWWRCVIRERDCA